MRYELREHQPHGIYYVVLRAAAGRFLWRGDGDREEFTAIVRYALHRHGARALAYSWATDDARLLLRIGSAPQSTVTKAISLRYARYLNAITHQTGYVFFHPHTAILLKAREQVLEAVRHLHLEAAAGDPPRTHAALALSSHAVYAGRSRISWVNTAAVRGWFGWKTGDWRAGYEQLMSSPSAFDGLSGPGDTAFSAWLSREARAKPPTCSLEEIIEAVTAKLQVSREELTSPSRKRRFSLARALVTWHASRNSVSPLGDIGRCLNRDPSTLYVGVQYYRARRPDLFKQPLHDLLRELAGRAGPIDET